MAQVNGTTMVPEKYRKNRFVTACWYVIETWWTTKGKWPTFQDFQRTAKGPDRDCREGVFADTLREMQLDETMKPRNLEPRLVAPVLKPHEIHTKEASSKLGDAIAAGIDKAAAAPAPPKREPVTPLRRQQAQEWIWANRNEGWGAFHYNFPEPEFDSAWFAKMKAEGTIQKNAEPAKPEIIPMPPIEFDPRVKAPVQKAANWLITLGSLEKIEGTTLSAFLEKSRLKGVESPHFLSARKIAARHFREYGNKVAPAPAAAKPAPAPAPAPAAVEVEEVPAEKRRRRPSGAFTSVDILGQIDLAPFDNLDKESLFKYSTALAQALVPDREIECVMLAWPPKLEIRART